MDRKENREELLGVTKKSSLKNDVLLLALGSRKEEETEWMGCTRQ